MRTTRHTTKKLEPLKKHHHEKKNPLKKKDKLDQP
jgi:hypothetical protein